MRKALVPAKQNAARNRPQAERRAQAFPFLTTVLWFCIALGIACRFVGLKWDWNEDQNALVGLHPDERFLAMTVDGLHWPQSASAYFQTDIAPLNPFNKPGVGLFVYGQLPLTITKATAAWLGRDNYEGIMLIGRILSALFDSGSVLLLFFIGRRLLPERDGQLLGLLAATLLALTVLHIQHAHFFVVDTFTTFFLLAAFLSLMRNTEHGIRNGNGEVRKSGLMTYGSSLIAGVCWGAAMACKISAALFGVVIALFIIAHARHTIHRSTMVLQLVTLLAAAFMTFRIAHPIAFEGTARPSTLWGLLDVRPFQPRLDQTGFWQSVRDQKAISDGTRDVPWNVQWIGRRDFLWPLRNLMLWGVGLPLGLAGAIGIGLILRRAIPIRKLKKKTNGETHGIVPSGSRQAMPIGLVVAALWTLVVIVYHASQFSKFTRYYLPATPFLALCAAWLLLEMRNFAHREQNEQAQKRHILHYAYQVPLWATLVSTALWALAFTSIYTRPHTRVMASWWIRQNIQPGTAVAVETSWDEGLPLGHKGGLTIVNLELYGRDAQHTYEPDSLAKRQALLDRLDQVEWIFVSSNRVWGTVPRWPQRWPLTTEYYRVLFDGRLGFEPVREFTSYPQLLGFRFADDSFEEALTVYDHPRVVLFRKSEAWSRAQAENILNERLLHAVSNMTLAQIRDSRWNPEALGQPPLPWLPSHAEDK